MHSGKLNRMSLRGVSHCYRRCGRGGCRLKMQVTVGIRASIGGGSSVSGFMGEQLSSAPWRKSTDGHRSSTQTWYATTSYLNRENRTDTEQELKARNINHARNLFDRAITLLPRVDAVRPLPTVQDHGMLGADSSALVQIRLSRRTLVKHPRRTPDLRKMDAVGTQ